jgi:hypothetical protein
MQLRIVRIEPTKQVSNTGVKKYYAYSAEGTRHIAWGEWVEDAKGKDINVAVKKESFKGSDYTVIRPSTALTDEEASVLKQTTGIPSEIAVRSRPHQTGGLDSSSYSSINKRERLMARESALKSATQVWSTKVTAGLDGKGQEDPLDMAKRFYEWILRD